MGNFDDQDKERSKVPDATTTLIGAQTPLERRKSQNGNLGIGGHVPDILERISGEDATQNSKNDSPVTLSPLCEDLFPNLTTISNGRPSTVNSVVGQTDLKPTKPKGTWTRMARMDVGPLDKASNIPKPTTGKRELGDALFENGNTETEAGFYKRSKVDGEVDSPFMFSASSQVLHSMTSLSIIVCEI
nr:hypothetical protein CFP56_26747 [Quercus suber]